MTFLEIYAVFGAPLLGFGIAYAMYRYASHAAR
jgi:hypothetical protein